MAPKVDPLQLTRELIAIESITGNEEHATARIEGALRALGLSVDSQQVAPGRRNLVATAGPERPRVLFCTHTDTVPPYVPLSEDDDWIRGRGACDTKGIAAAMLAAGEKLLARGFRDFGYLFVVGEETDNAGAKVANRKVHAGQLIVGEPTEMKVALGHKGVLRVQVTARGQACHSAYPERGDSAIHRLLGGLGRVIAADFGHSELLGRSTVNVGEISGGVAANVLAPHAEAMVMIRVVTSVVAVRRTLEACFSDPHTGRMDPQITFASSVDMEPCLLDRVEGYPECVVSYGTDIPHLLEIGTAGRPVLFGPGSILDAHTDGEKIRKRDILAAADAYADLALKLATR